MYFISLIIFTVEPAAGQICVEAFIWWDSFDEACFLVSHVDLCWVSFGFYYPEDFHSTATFFYFFGE